jgi:hypothetical protein
MSTAAGEATRSRRDFAVSHRSATETKHSSKTTEFYAMVGVIAATLIAAWYVGRNGGGDSFRAHDAWLYVSIVASAYMISRGLAKSGSREPYSDDADRR